MDGRRIVGQRGKKNVPVSVSNLNVWGALELVNTTFEMNFIIRGRTITIGTEGVEVGDMFSYGKGNGLYQIERNSEQDKRSLPVEGIR